jgi:hypothetical protein
MGVSLHRHAVDVQRSAHLCQGFRILAPLGKFRAEQVAQLRVSGVANDGGTDLKP